AVLTSPATASVVRLWILDEKMDNPSIIHAADTDVVMRGMVADSAIDWSKAHSYTLPVAILNSTAEIDREKVLSGVVSRMLAATTSNSFLKLAISSGRRSRFQFFVFAKISDWIVSASSRK